MRSQTQTRAYGINKDKQPLCWRRTHNIIMIIVVVVVVVVIIITIIMMMMMMMMMIIAFKGAVREVLQSPHCAASHLQHVRSSGPGAIVCKSRAIHRALIAYTISRYVVRRDSSAIKFNRVDIAFILTFILLAGSDEGREEAGIPGENLREMPHTKTPKRDSNPHNSFGGRLGKLTC